MSARRLSRIIEGAHALPSLPAVVGRLVSAMANEQLGLDALAQHVESDPVLAARILAAANAGAYGAQKVATIPQAIALLGINRVHDIAVQSAMLEVFTDAGVPDSLRAIWLESLAAAICAEELAARTGANRSIAHVAGLLHDIGKLLLYAVLGNEYLEVLAQAAQSGRPIAELEREMIGVDHAMVGGELVRTWQLPDVIADAIVGHAASVSPDVVRSAMGDIVHCGVVLAHAMDLAGSPDNCVPLLDEAACLRIGLRWDQMDALLARIEGRFVATRATLGECTRRCGPIACSGACQSGRLAIPRHAAVAA